MSQIWVRSWIKLNIVQICFFLMHSQWISFYIGKRNIVTVLQFVMKETPIYPGKHLQRWSVGMVSVRTVGFATGNRRARSSSPTSFQHDVGLYLHVLIADLMRNDRDFLQRNWFHPQRIFNHIVNPNVLIKLSDVDISRILWAKSLLSHYLNEKVTHWGGVLHCLPWISGTPVEELFV